jgi:LacI family transcriptional regulator
MTHRFPIKEIALQSGLGSATIDRVINNRANVSPQTRTRVAAAIAELEDQEAQLAARGRRMFFDFVIEAPTRFSHEVRVAAQKVLPQIGAAVCRPRFLLQEIMSQDDVVQALHRIAKRGSHGVCLKARDLPLVRDAVDRLARAGIPVVTLVTDIKASGRVAYVGLDNHSAGRTAAYLLGQFLPHTTGTILTTKSNERFLGEEERETAFLQALAACRPGLEIIDASGGSGVHFETSRRLNQVIDRLSNLRAVYSMGGGNRTIVDLLRQNRLTPDIFIAHDLDADNRALIQSGDLSFVLYHDLAVDLQNVFRTFLHHHKLLSDDNRNTASNIQIITPHNVPVQK